MQNGCFDLPKLFVDNPDLAGRALYDFNWPVACFDSGGRIICANSVFCSLTGLSHDHISSGAAYISECVNTRDVRLRNAIENIPEGETLTLSRLVRPLCALPDTDSDRKYTEAILYSLSGYESKGGYNCLIFKENNAASTRSDRIGRVIGITAVCTVTAIVMCTLVFLTGKTDKWNK